MNNRELTETETKAVIFKRLYGVKPETFERMKDILQKSYNELHKNGGKPPELTVMDKLYKLEIFKGIPDNGKYRYRLRRRQKRCLRINTMGGRHA